MTPVLAVVGPTATGKSDLAVALAERVGGEVVNADSMQLYRGMDIGTAKLPPGQRRGVPHHLLDIWPIPKSAAVAEYQQLARSRDRRHPRARPAARPRRRLRPVPARRARPPRVPGGVPGDPRAPLRRTRRARCTGPARRTRRARPGGGRRHPGDQRTADRARARGHRADRPALHRDDAGLRVRVRHGVRRAGPRRPRRSRRTARRRDDRARLRRRGARPARRRPAREPDGGQGARLCATARRPGRRAASWSATCTSRSRRPSARPAASSGGSGPGSAATRGSPGWTPPTRR